ncbi:hypothetical protein CFN78_03280 [Amycolatopsis antarctica]|uniref:Secreted protein n=2 Tax=Amycolatopsis antarctica TaxID=1854586 RepID=A0A263DCH7_9PSEU|nr:hypothetical protein CFN78_03280 [Amycolatopsis antarctica]
MPRFRGSARRTAAVLASAALGLGVCTASGSAAAPAGRSGPAPLVWSATAAGAPPGGNTVTDAGGTRLAGGPPSASARTGERTGIQDLPAETLAAPVGSVGAELDADIPAGARAAADVRTLRADGTWSEWTEIPPDAPATLPEPSATVQARLVLIAPEGAESPRVRGARFAAGPAVAATAARESRAATYRLFATREGLVGGTTANGHVIVPRDHFVALPSRKGLAGKGTGNYTVRVCTENLARCEWAPVWDVGPWNTKDDHWNQPRQTWQDLPLGLPQAQAAYSDGHNGGKDGFGRRVANPAGIDLADGTFWDGLKLTGNAWVQVTYEWTGGGPVGTVTTSGIPLKVRTGPSTATAEAGFAASTAQVRLGCRATGQSVSGTEGTTDAWYLLESGKYVSGAYLRVAAAPPAC